MSLPVPLSVRLVTATADRHVTRELRNLTFRATAPRGFASATMSFGRRLDLTQVDIAEYARVYVYAPNGDVVWEGRLEDPSRNVGSDGSIYELSAIGGGAHTRDTTAPLVYIDTSLSTWTQTDNFTAGAQVGVGADPGQSADVQAIICRLPMGTSVQSNARGVAGHALVANAAMKLARVAFDWDAGRTTTAFNVRANVNTNNGTNTQIFTATANSAGGTVAKVVGTDWTLGANIAQLLIHWPSGPITLTEDTDWASFRNVAIVAVRMDALGNEITTGYTANTCTTDDIVTDLVGRLLPLYDGAAASIAGGSYQVDQLAYPDGVTPEKVLEDLMALDDSFYWAVWESDPSSGLYFFEWTNWGSKVRFEASIVDGFASPASTEELYDQVRVRYRDPSGVIKTVLRTQTVALLQAAGISRTGFIDLGDDVGSAANAAQAGDQFLADHATQPNRGTLTIARPIMDLGWNNSGSVPPSYGDVGGRMMQPWELPRRAPGALIRVRGVVPHADSLNASARDGATVFRVVAAEYDAASNSTKLELDSFAITLPRVMSTLVRAPALRRR